MAKQKQTKPDFPLAWAVPRRVDGKRGEWPLARRAAAWENRRMNAPTPITVFIDADACPVKDETYRVAQRNGLKTYVVANSFMMIPTHPLIERVVVEAGPDVADDWIAERVSPGDVVITNDIPLAGRRRSAARTAPASCNRSTRRSRRSCAAVARHRGHDRASRWDVSDVRDL
jgi:hypothetical protein